MQKKIVFKEWLEENSDNSVTLQLKRVECR